MQVECQEKRLNISSLQDKMKRTEKRTFYETTRHQGHLKTLCLSAIVTAAILLLPYLFKEHPSGLYVTDRATQTPHTAWLLPL
ncbi:hypothetical protein J4Q44_G00090090 [Coregonus suidteri]|uniref:Uncharacterized protein n=1 Tax=Coregonus suidteri TaxID=861788 RepID=A0AAN8M659_9TELE